MTVARDGAPGVVTSSKSRVHAAARRPSRHRDPRRHLLSRGHSFRAGGGFLGVDAFFVLSGYLITTLLVREWQSREFRLPLELLAPTGPSAAAGSRTDAALRLCVCGFLRTAPDQLAGIRGDAEHPRLRCQSAPNRCQSGLFRAEQLHVAPPAHLVPGDRRAVLPHLAADHRWGDVWRKSLRLCLVVALVGCVGSALEIGAALSSGRRPVSPVLRNRHPSAEPPSGCGARAALGHKTVAPAQRCRSGFSLWA